MTTIDDILGWRTSDLTAAAASWRSLGRRLEQTADGLDAYLGGIGRSVLDGDIRELGHDAMTRRAGALRRDGASLHRAAGVLDDAAAELGPAVEKLRRAVDRARGAGHHVDPATGVLSGGPRRVRPDLASMTDVLQSEVVHALKAVRDADGRLAEAMAHHRPAGPVHLEGAGIDPAVAVEGLRPAQRAEVERLLGDRGSGVTVLETAPGTTAVAHGDLRRARNLLTLVPGTGSTADDIAAQVDKLKGDYGEDTAVVVWTYDAPPGLTHAASAAYATEAGHELQAFQSRMTERGFARMDVVGHSYGSTVVAQATTGGGLRADTVTLIGSPGVGPGIGSVRDMKLIRHDGTAHDAAQNSRRVIANTSALDVISVPASTGVLGWDPMSPGFGATRHRSFRGPGLRMLDPRTGAGPWPPAAELEYHPFFGSHTHDYFPDEDWRRDYRGWIREIPGSGPGTRG